MDCGLQFSHYVMDFDHVRGQKLFKLAEARDDNLSTKRLRAEIAKCEVVCSNCHRERTWQRGQMNGGAGSAAARFKSSASIIESQLGFFINDGESQ